MPKRCFAECYSSYYVPDEVRQRIALIIRATPPITVSNYIMTTSFHHVRKANMTLTQSLKLCQRRRPVVDPIPAFLDQLATYERECRTLGYLTAVDDTGRNNETGDNIAKVHANGKDVAIGGQKRKVEVGDGDDGKKNKVILGPVIGPSAPTTPPITCHGRSAVIGPARGPPTKEQVVENPKTVEAKESN